MEAPSHEYHKTSTTSNEISSGLQELSVGMTSGNANVDAATNTTTTTTTTATSNPSVRVLDQARIEIIPFGVALTKSELRTDWDTEPTEEIFLPLSSSLVQVGVVGTITILNNAAVVWFGWGRLGKTTTNTSDGITAVTKEVKRGMLGTGLPRMGPVVVGMPRTKYQGAFSDGREGTCSSLVGGDSCDDQVLTSQMASRLSQRVGLPIFVSGDLSSNYHVVLGDELLSGLDPSLVAQRAAALAEREVGRLLKDIFNKV